MGVNVINTPLLYNELCPPVACNGKHDPCESGPVEAVPHSPIPFSTTRDPHVYNSNPHPERVVPFELHLRRLQRKLEERVEEFEARASNDAMSNPDTPVENLDNKGGPVPVPDAKHPAVGHVIHQHKPGIEDHFNRFSDNLDNRETPVRSEPEPPGNINIIEQPRHKPNSELDRLLDMFGSP